MMGAIILQGMHFFAPMSTMVTMPFAGTSGTPDSGSALHDMEAKQARARIEMKPMDAVNLKVFFLFNTMSLPPLSC